MRLTRAARQAADPSVAFPGPLQAGVRLPGAARTGGMPRPSQVPVPGQTSRRAGTAPAPARRMQLRPSGALAGAAPLLARPSAIPEGPVLDVLRGPGYPLAPLVREEMETRLGADFSQVRVHVGSAARAAAAEASARAYTVGDNVVLGASADKNALAHELVHVLQQRQGPVAGTDQGNGLKVSDPSDRFEREAAVTAAQAMSGSAAAFPLGRRPGGPKPGPAAQLRPNRPSLQRLPVGITQAGGPVYPRPVDLYADLGLEPEHELIDLATLERWWVDDQRHGFISLPAAAAAVRAARSQPGRIPPTPGRARFSVDPRTVADDIAQRAITSFTLSVQTGPGLGDLKDRIHQFNRYRRNPSAIDLSQALGNVMRTGSRIRLRFPSATGEVMYVITENYELIIGARSGRQHDLPHPALISGEDPTVLSAGIVKFAAGRIMKVEINASGHFKPNAPSSVEVSAALFNQLPPWAFHPEFEGFSVFGHQHPPLGLLPGPPREEEAAPFDIAEGPEERGSIATPAIAAQSDKVRLDQLVNLTSGKKPWKRRLKEAQGWLKNDLVDSKAEPGLAAVFSPQMSADYQTLLAALQAIAGGKGPRFQALARDPVSKRLAGQLRQVLKNLMYTPKNAQDQLKNDLAGLEARPGLAAVFSPQMSADYQTLLAALQAIDARDLRLQALAGDEVYLRLAGQLEQELTTLRADAATEAEEAEAAEAEAAD